MRYTIVLERDASRAIDRLSGALRRRVLHAIEALAENPRPHGVLKLTDTRNRWRIRVGDYRVIYEIHDGRLVVVVLDVAHRSKAY